MFSCTAGSSIDDDDVDYEDADDDDDDVDYEDDGNNDNTSHYVVNL